MANQEETAKGLEPKRRVKTSRQEQSLLYSYKPTQEQAKDIDKKFPDAETALDILVTLVERGLKLTVNYHGKTDSFYATLAESDVAWNKARGLSCWHSDPSKALKGVMYAAVYVYPEFPDGDWPPSSSAVDW